MMFKIEAKPVGANGTKTPGKNEGGLVINLVSTSSGAREEVGRVAFERKNSSHPDVDAPTQIKTYMDAAKAAVDAVNDLLDSSGTLQ